MDEQQAIISELVGEAYPPVSAVGARLRRNWIIRSVSSLPDTATLLHIQSKIENAISAVIVNTYSGAGQPEQLKLSIPSVRLVRLDDSHLIVRIEFAGPDVAIGDSAAISQWGVLQRFDREIEIDDLQGLPGTLWFFLRASRESMGRE